MTLSTKGYGTGWQSYLKKRRKLKHAFSELLPGTQLPAEQANYGLTPPADYWLDYHLSRTTAETWATQRPAPRREGDSENRKPQGNLSIGKRGPDGVSLRGKTNAGIDGDQNEALAIQLPTALVVHLRHWAFMKEVSLAAVIEEALAQFCQALAAENKKQAQDTEAANLLSGNDSLITESEKELPCSPPRTPREKKKLGVEVFARY